MERRGFRVREVLESWREAADRGTTRALRWIMFFVLESADLKDVNDE
jgi:hypothetical protein